MCQFVFDPELWPTDVRTIDEKWECIYPSLPGESYCIFHVLPNRRNYVLPTKRAKLEALAWTLRSENGLYIVGTTWVDFDFDFVTSLLTEDSDIQIICSSFLDFESQGDTVESDLYFSQCWFNSFDVTKSEFSGAFIAESTEFVHFSANRAVFEERVVFEDCRFVESEFVEAEFYRNVQFCGDLPVDLKVEKVPEYLGDEHSVFEKTPNFLGTEFYGSALFSGCEFHQCGQFMESDFRSGVSFEGVECKIGMNFSSAIFRDKTSFDHANLGWANFKSVTFEDITWFRSTEFGGQRDIISVSSIKNQARFEGILPGVVDGYQSVLEDPLLESYLEEIVGWAAGFMDCRNQGRLMFRACEATDPVSMRQANLGSIELEFDTNQPSSAIVLDKSEVESGIIYLDEENNGYYQMSDTIVDKVDLEYSNLNPFQHLFIERTVFERFNFTNYRKELEEIDWKIDGVIVEDQH